MQDIALMGLFISTSPLEDVTSLSQISCTLEALPSSYPP
ncbi:hypothetical protein L1F34_002035 [Mammaliicoccus lentus]